MKIGINIRVMGPQSSREIIREVLINAEQAGIESAWVVDHIAIPPDDAEGSDGRYLDPLTTLAWMAGQTQTIKIGTSVLILPYRPKLPTAKAIATLQELSAGRLLLGIGVGWMGAEFRALGIDRRQRGKMTDSMLSFLHDCFSNEVMIANEQPFLFKPQPVRPPIYIGGDAPHAIERALSYGDGWLPMGKVSKLAAQIADYKSRSLEEREQVGEVVTFMEAPSDLAQGEARLAEYAAAGIDRVIVGQKYTSAKQWLPTLDILSQLTQ
ncbi:MAG: TIGR03619 family F420-dependent LLM class oxidoreductase [Pseudomonadota bacterium]